MDGLRELGEDVWFNLGDRDLAICLRRARRLAEGARLTEAIDELRRALGVPARVLPMCDDPVRTYVRTQDGWRAFQEFMIRERAEGPVEGVEFRGAREGAASRREVREALATADAIVIGPSNPVLSIDPILACRRDARRVRQRAPWSPSRRSCAAQVLKGPTAAFMAWAGRPLGTDGIAAHYDGLIDGLVADERATEMPTLETDVELGDAAGAPARRGRGARRSLSDRARAHRRGPARQVVRPRQAAARRTWSAARIASSSPRRWSPTCWPRWRPSRSSTT